MKNFHTKWFLIALVLVCIGAGMLLSLIMSEAIIATSGGDFCINCHSMKPMVDTYYESLHGGANKTGVVAKCTDCHLPHENIAMYVLYKGLISAHDIYAEVFYDKDKIDWIGKSERDEVKVYDSGCLKCHANYFDATAHSRKALIAHKAYKIRENKKCSTCHKVGHKDLIERLKLERLKRSINK